MFGSNVKKAKEEVNPHFTSDDLIKTRKFLLRNLRWYLDQDEDDPDYIAAVCQIVDALNKVQSI